MIKHWITVLLTLRKFRILRNPTSGITTLQLNLKLTLNIIYKRLDLKPIVLFLIVKLIFFIKQALMYCFICV